MTGNTATGRAGLRHRVALRPRLIGGPLSWAPEESFPKGGKPPTPKESTIFRRAEGANENFCVFRDFFLLVLRVYIASAEGASKNFWGVS